MAASDPRKDDNPSVRQRLHSATGDRDAEAVALADRAGDDVGAEEAEVAVRRAHGDIPGGEVSNSDLASPEEAREAHEERDA
jgi:hypothetical protein